MAAEAEWSCPVCYGRQDGVASVLPCAHQFCLGCVLRWAEKTPTCPLCRTRMVEVRFSMRGEDDYLEWGFAAPEEPSEDGSLPESRASSPQGMPFPEEAAGTEARPTVGGILPEVWAELFQRNRYLLNPVRPWLRQELEEIYEEEWWMVVAGESLIVEGLCSCGPDEEALVQWVERDLGEDAEPLVHGLIEAIECRCTPEAWSMLNSVPSEEEDVSPPASPSPSSGGSSWANSSSSSPSSCRESTPGPDPASCSSAAGSEEEQPPTTMEADLCGGPSRPPSAPIPEEQHQPQEEPGQAAAAGPSAQGCSRSPSAPGRGRDRSPRGPRRPPKRTAPDSPDSAQPCKRPPRRRH
ncbi:TOPRS ligase, partial [Chionis minor]|nr:TOPRS ligase [Chionis minor]NWY61600.1 TOPRS ligase [Chionis minor]